MCLLSRGAVVSLVCSCRDAFTAQWVRQSQTRIANVSLQTTMSRQVLKISTPSHVFQAPTLNSFSTQHCGRVQHRGKVGFWGRDHPVFVPSFNSLPIRITHKV